MLAGVAKITMLAFRPVTVMLTAAVDPVRDPEPKLGDSNATDPAQISFI